MSQAVRVHPLFQAKARNEETERVAFVAEAKSWLGTPFRDQAM